MGVSQMDSANGTVIESVGQMYGRFSGELVPQLSQWEQRLLCNPDSLEQIELEVQQTFLRGAGMISAGLIAVVLLSKELAHSSELTRRQYSHPLARGRSRSIRIRLLGGFFMWINSLYCEPKKGVFRRSSPDISGLYIELAQFGFGKGVTPALQSTVSRQAALCPSLQFAKLKLSRNGIQLDVKTVRRIANECGEDLLKLRKHRLQAWRAGTLSSTDELADKKVTVQIDGGRTRMRSVLKKVVNPKPKEETDSDGLLRQDAKGRSKKSSKSSFDSPWREPKLCSIFVHDDEGRMVKHSQATIDGTLEGPDALAEIVAMQLHRLGAAKAISITFVADGATWIWDRIEKIVSAAKIPSTATIYQVLDCCHAVHHISMALTALGLNDFERMPLYRVHRTLLRNGQWRQVVSELESIAEDRHWPEKVSTEIEYLRKHGEAGRLSFVFYRQQGLPIGSGAIESSIRRVINNRMKSNGMFWRAENAEIMLQLRCQVISNRWDESVSATRNMNRTTAISDWRWIPEPMTCKTEASESVDTITKKTQGKT